MLVSLLLYQVYKLMKGSVAVKIFGGFLSIYLVYLVVKAAQMELLSSILGQFMGVGVIAAIILFQQEIRKFLLIIGKTTSFSLNLSPANFSFGQLVFGFGIALIAVSWAFDGWHNLNYVAGEIKNPEQNTTFAL